MKWLPDRILVKHSGEYYSINCQRVVSQYIEFRLEMYLLKEKNEFINQKLLFWHNERFLFQCRQGRKETKKITDCILCHNYNLIVNLFTILSLLNNIISLFSSIFIFSKNNMNSKSYIASMSNIGPLHKQG